MLLAFVAQIQRDGIQRRKALADDLFARHHGLGGSVAAVLGGSSCTYFESHSACAITNAIMSPMPPKSLKFTHVSVEKLYATQRFSVPLKRKNTPHATHSLVQIGSGSAMPSLMTALTRLVPKARPPRKTTPASQYSTDGFHLMNVSFLRKSAAPPKSTMITRLVHCMF